MQPIKLLVVEDNQGDVVLLRECLRDSAFPLELTLAKDGEIAVNLLFEQGFRPDLIVLDLNLPKLDGHEVLKALGSNGIGAIPVIIMTSSQNSAEIDRAFAEGANGYLPKVTSFEEFQLRVHDTISPWLQAIAKSK